MHGARALLWRLIKAQNLGLQVLTDEGKATDREEISTPRESLWDIAAAGVMETTRVQFRVALDAKHDATKG